MFRVLRSMLVLALVAILAAVPSVAHATTHFLQAAADTGAVTPPAGGGFLSTLIGQLALPILTIVSSALVFGLNKVTGLLNSIKNDWVKRAIVMVVGSALGYLGPKLNIDVTTLQGAAAGIAAALVYWLRSKAAPASPTP